MAALLRVLRRAVPATLASSSMSATAAAVRASASATLRTAGSASASALSPLTAGLMGGLHSVFARHKSYALSAQVIRVPSGSVGNQIERNPRDRGSRRSVNIAESGRDAFRSSIKRFKPITPSLRHTALVHRPYLWRGGPLRALTRAIRKTGGRNSTGRVTVRHRGGGHKRRYRLIDFQRSVYDVPGVVQRLEYDPNRSCDIALVLYPDGRVHYIIAPQDVLPGDTVLASRANDVELVPGNAMPMSRMPIGTVIHNVELNPGEGGSIARSAGASCQLLDKLSKPGYVLVRLQSKEQRYLRAECMATIGVVSNPLHHLRVLGKAGRSRWLGRRPATRGVAKNPVDHPMGGGNGKTSGGRPSCSPWGWPTKGYKTGNKKKASRKLVVVPRGGIAKGMSVVVK